MAYQAFTHIALIVSPLRRAEEFYRTLFALEVAFREAETADGWYTLPPMQVGTTRKRLGSLQDCARCIEMPSPLPWRRG